jgi:predicted enzyme involved in methoxymalonyl-ACP biosynthesis
MIGVAICRPDAEENGLWDIDTWLMSCRVLGRKVEEGMLSKVAGALHERGATRLIGRYFPTAKNDMVRDHYGKLGFELIEETAEGRVFALPLAGYVVPDLPFRIVDNYPAKTGTGRELAAAI